MSLSSVFDVFNPALALLHSGLATLAGALPPVLGGAEVAVALVLITCVVRACLLPLAVSVLRAASVWGVWRSSSPHSLRHCARRKR
jgi:hypothetical protein